MRAWFLALLAALLTVAACGGSPVRISHVLVPSLKNTVASFDVVEIDQQAHRLYAADRTDGGVDVFDTTSVPAKYLKTIAMPAEPSGLALAPDLGLAFAGLADGSVAIVDTRNDTLVKAVATGAKGIDLIDYAPSTQTVYASAAAEGTIASVDAPSATLDKVIKVGYALEQPRFNPADGLLYVTSPGADALFRIDPATGKIKDKLALGGCSPTGLAINPRLDQALIACGSWLIRMNLRNPSDVKGFTQVGGGDVIGYDAAVDRFLVAAPGAKPSEVALFGGDPVDYVTAVVTRGLGNSAAYDEKNGMIYTPDVMPGRAGLDAFNVPSGGMAFSIPGSTLAVFGGIIAVAVLLLFVIGRLADPVRKPAPLAPRTAPVETAIRPGARKWTRKA